MKQEIATTFGYLRDIIAIKLLMAAMKTQKLQLS